MYFKERKLPLSSEADYIGFAKRLPKTVGDKPINEHTVNDFRNFKELLLDFPVAYFDLEKVNDFRSYLNSLHTSKPNYRKITPLTGLPSVK